MRVVLQKIREANLKLKLTKCKWFKQKLTFVRYKITARNIKLDPRNIEKIKNARVSNSTTELRGFLGTAQFYRQFVKDYADIARPIYDMLKDDAPRDGEVYIISIYSIVYIGIYHGIYLKNNI